jgi:periplasmic protein TonB
MNMYEESSLFSGRKGAALTAVILLHIVFGFAFYSELAARIGNKLDPSPLNITRIETPKETIKPPPALPLIDQLRIYVTPPEIPPFTPPYDPVVTVDDAPSDPLHVIPQAPPQPSASTKVRTDPKHPLRIGEDYYPDASRRANEEGRCMVRVTVAADGRIIGASIQTSSGFDRLDQACLKGVRGQHMLAATEDGKPIEQTILMPISWKLSDR